MQTIISVLQMSSPHCQSHVDPVTAKLIAANLFFFEPHERTSSVSHSPLADPSYDTLAGSIRCLLGHDGIPLRNLLVEMAESFWYTEASSADTEKLSGTGVPWRLNQMTIKENEVKKFRVNHIFVTGLTRLA
jgi:hypothetical protein